MRTGKRAAVEAALVAGLAAIHCSAQTQFTISTVAGDGTPGYSGNGASATGATLHSPTGVAVDAPGNVYVADFGNNVIRKIAPNGIITTIAGTGTAGYQGDGGPATQALLDTPLRVLPDSQGNLYIADSANNCVRKVTPGGIITTIAGTGNAGYSGDGGPATSADLDYPADLVFDTAGNLFISTNGFNYAESVSVIREVSPSGTITTFAGSGPSGFSGDGGPALSATLSAPKGLAFDVAGNLLIADQSNNRIRMISNGIITTIAGTDKAGFSGDGGPAVAAQLHSPAGVSLGAAGDLYIADRDNGRIRVLLANGTIETVAGYRSAGGGGDGAAATDGALNSPRSVALTPAGAVYVADTDNDRIRLLTPASTPPVVAVNGASYAAAPVAVNSIVSAFGPNLTTETASASAMLSTTLGGTSVQITDSTGAAVLADLFYVSPTQINLLIPATLATGLGQIQVTSGDGAVLEGPLEILDVVPGLFTTSNGLALGYALQIDAEGNEASQNLVQYNATSAQFEAVPINLGASTDTTYLILYGTGMRNASLSQVTVSIGGLTLAPAYAGAQPDFAGLDQVNLEMPSSLAGAGDVAITLTAAGIGSNTVNITIQ